LKQLPRPNLISHLLFPLLYFASAKLCLALATTHEGLVIVWLPNAFSLAALLYYRGQRYWLFMLLMLGAEVAGDVPTFPWYEAVVLGAANIAEVTIGYLLMRRYGMSQTLDRLDDVVKFIGAGPLCGSLVGAFLGAAAITFFGAEVETYFSAVRIWWFGDALGLAILTPLLLTAFRPVKHPISPLQRIDLVVIAISAGVAGMVLSAQNGVIWGAFITPTLLLPSMLYLAARTNLKWATIGVFIVSFAIVFLITTERQPFGDQPLPLTIVHAQEFIFILCLASMGFATLLSHIRDNERDLERRVAERTDELQILNRKLEALNNTDGLTDIANRRCFDEVLAREWNRAIRVGQPLAILMLDVDWFKSYNDHYGHQAGDECLRRVAGMMNSSACRSGDLVARYGGEEFVMIAPMTDGDSALAIARKVCAAIEALALPHELSKFSCVTASIGVASMLPSAEVAPDRLLKAADDAMYMAKENGRNQAVLG
jgi:diguanylate cyclase (GGDEF)-like protein